LPEPPASPVVAGSSEARAAVTIYHPPSLAGHGGGPAAAVAIDGREVAKVKSGSFVRVELEPGRHRFMTGPKRAPVGFELELEPGRERFLRLDGDGPFYPVCDEQGATEIQGRMQALPGARL
jgi:hypothetical protein